MQEQFVSCFCLCELLWFCWEDLQVSIFSNTSIAIPSFLHPSPCPAKQDKASQTAFSLVFFCHSVGFVCLGFFNTSVTAPAHQVMRASHGLLSS